MDIDPEMIEKLSGNLDERQTRAVPKNSIRDKLYPGEDTYFKTNPHVSGMMAEDNRIIINPYSPPEPRRDGTPKGKGWLGVLPVIYPDGKVGVATEYSVGIRLDNKETEIPTLIPTLTPEEKNFMLNDIIPNHKQVPEPILRKAVEHAKQRMKQGFSPYKD